MIKLSLEGLTSQKHEDNLYWSGSSYYQLIEGEFILVRIGQQKGNYRQLSHYGYDGIHYVSRK